MSDTVRPGYLIAVSGIDGAGKTTQVKELASWLQDQGIKVQCLLNQSMLPVRRSLDAIAQEDGFSGHLDMLGADTIRLISACAKLAALAPVQDNLQVPGMVTLVDRYTYCQYAAVRLQKADNEAYLRRLNRALPTPDLTLFLDVSPEIAQQRIRKRGIDDETLDFLTTYRAAYRSLPEYESFTVLDGDGDLDSVQRRLRTEVQRVLPAQVPAASEVR
ncbi:thymidylate kinase [Streptomyces sp. Ncost-T6T-1]|uniref:dTMP kinase n=1 Tax=Streptomyces sp. Ncost-T6T-1 TaxID=1100828 RepID=UPI000805C0FC|nr:AAA family ATPase [Streptomyces sp. Ncost-T6T-1]SBU91982.1 thymidylate kinase [Streptomyces sp. Ncost-T6T-1]